jgi:glycosyltransferase involved in cell wall biosynthesis
MDVPRGRGQQYLIQAARILEKDFPEARYLIVGSGPLYGELRKLAHTMGINEKIVFTGYRENVEKCIAAMDIFCLPTLSSEGFGQVMLEAQGMGKPVVGTSIGGIPETFLNGVTGYLVPPESVESLVRMLTLLLENRAHRKQMGIEAARFVRQNFSIDLMAERTIAVYKELYR